MTGKRTKSAHVWDRDPDDWYVEPEWCSARLFDEEQFTGPVWDPSCGLGRVVEQARAAGLSAIGTDLRKRSEACSFTVDFLTDGMAMIGHDIVANPPFKAADAFVAQALRLASGKVAMLLPTKWLSSNRRAAWLQTTPLRRVWFMTPRPSMPPGAVIEAGIAPGNGTADFCWVVWLKGYDGAPEFRWLRRDA